MTTTATARRPIVAAIFFFSIQTAHAQLMVISSMRHATSFIHRSGDPIYIHPGETDTWRICPPNLDATHCFPSYISSPKCTVITPDCRCYNWYFQDTPTVKTLGACVYVQIPFAAETKNLTWALDYTYPTLPPGYVFFQHLLYSRLLGDHLTFDDYSTITAPLLCEAASSLLDAAFDNCLFTYNLRVAYLPGTSVSNPHPAIVGPFVLVALAVFNFAGYLSILHF